MARQRLADLVKQGPPTEPPATSSVAGEDGGGAEPPKYLTLVRKECRLRDDQVEALTRLSRQLSRRRRGSGGERITENTLIRVAVDVLLAQGERLAGASED
ncbi:MAG: hypothetical protein ACRDZY_20495, partial [Acidimicrobiales bacterium]